jgi:hypothetical protein
MQSGRPKSGRLPIILRLPVDAASTAAMGRCGLALRHHARQRLRLLISVERVLLSRAIDILLRTVGLIELLLALRIGGIRTFRVVRYALMQLLFQLGLLQLIVHLLLLHGLLEAHARRRRDYHRRRLWLRWRTGLCGGESDLSGPACRPARSATHEHERSEM